MSEPSALDVLTRGAATLKGRLPWSSNATFLAEIRHEATTVLAVYKPERGERPLWDFPPALYRREVAAYRLSEALGWHVVPPTVTGEGPLGPGSLQLFMPADFEQHYFTFREDPAHRERLLRICALDLVANNADRKAGHCLLAEDGRVWAIDNALTFHVEPKLRTVIWDFAGEPLPAAMRADLARLAADPPELGELLDDDERAALVTRARRLVRAGRFPVNPGGRNYPWPLV